MKVDRSRFAVIDGSFWRRLPAAALRGFANACLPFSTAATFSASKRHVHLAAQLHRRVRVAQAAQRALAQAQRHVLHRAHVGGDVLARGAVAARCGAHQAAVLVRERDGRAVDLELAHHGHHAPERLRHTLDPRVQLVQVHGVVQRVHAPGMAHGSELLAHVAAHALRGAGRVDQLGMRGLQLAQLAHERVERGVGYLGRVVGVVQVAVMLDLAPKRVDARRRIVGRFRKRLLVEQSLLFVCHIRHRFVQSGRRPRNDRGLRLFSSEFYHEPRNAARSARGFSKRSTVARLRYAAMALPAFQP